MTIRYVNLIEVSQSNSIPIWAFVSGDDLNPTEPR